MSDDRIYDGYCFPILSDESLRKFAESLPGPPSSNNESLEKIDRRISDILKILEDNRSAINDEERYVSSSSKRKKHKENKYSKDILEPIMYLFLGGIIGIILIQLLSYL